MVINLDRYYLGKPFLWFSKKKLPKMAFRMIILGYEDNSFSFFFKFKYFTFYFSQEIHGSATVAYLGSTWGLAH